MLEKVACLDGIDNYQARPLLKEPQVHHKEGSSVLEFWQ